MLHVHFNDKSINNKEHSKEQQEASKRQEDSRLHSYLELLTFEKCMSYCQFVCLYQIPVTYGLDECRSESVTMRHYLISKPGASDSPVNMRRRLTELQATENKSE